MKRIFPAFSVYAGHRRHRSSGAKQASVETRRHSRHVRLYADITGPGSEIAAKMRGGFCGEVLGRKIEIVVADHLNKADLSANIARDMFDNQASR